MNRRGFLKLSGFSVLGFLAGCTSIIGPTPTPVPITSETQGRLYEPPKIPWWSTAFLETPRAEITTGKIELKEPKKPFPQ